MAASSQQTSMVQATRKGYPLHVVVSLLFPRCIAKLTRERFGSRDTHQSNWTARSVDDQPVFIYFSHKKLYRRIGFISWPPAGSAATSFPCSAPLVFVSSIFFSDGSNCLSGVSLRRQLIDAVLLHRLDRSLLILIPWVIFS